MFQKKLSIFATTAVASAALLVNANAACVLKELPYKDNKACKVAVGYADGKMVGAFRNGGLKVGLTPACSTLPGFNKDLGKVVARNQIEFFGNLYTLTEDCRNSTRQ